MNSMIIAQSMLVKVFPDLHPYLWGQATLELFTFPIPRALWAGKPVNAVYETITHFVPERRTPPLFGQFFADFGFLGVFLSMAIVGMVNAYMFRIWRQNETSEFSRVALALTLSWLLVLYTRNPIQGLTWFGFTFAPIYALQLITRRPGARGRHGFATKSVRFNEATP